MTSLRIQPSPHDVAIGLESKLIHLCSKRFQPTYAQTDHRPRWSEAVRSVEADQLAAYISATEMQFEAFMRAHHDELSTEPRWQVYYAILAEFPYYVCIAPSTAFSCYTRSDAYSETLAYLAVCATGTKVEIDIYDSRHSTTTPILSTHNTYENAVRQVRWDALSHEAAKALVIARCVVNQQRAHGFGHAAWGRFLLDRDRDRLPDLAAIADWAIAEAEREAVGGQPSVWQQRMQPLGLRAEDVRTLIDDLDVERELMDQPRLPEARYVDATLREWLTGMSDYVPDIVGSAAVRYETIRGRAAGITRPPIEASHQSSPIPA